MAKKRKSRNNKNNKKINFHNVLQHYKAGEYEQTYNLIRKGNIPTQYANQAKQLRVICSNYLALEYIKNFEFKKVIQLLEPNLKLTAKADFPLPLIQTKILLGIGHLYQGEFVKASEHLAFTKDSTDPTIQSFCFYHILAELYQKKFIDESVQNIFKALPENRQQYLMAVFYLHQNDLNNFKKVINTLTGTTLREKNNLVALQNIFNEKNASTIDKPQYLKGLYKLYNNLFIEDIEKNFLVQHQEIEQYLKEQKSQVQQQNLEQQIIRLFEEHQLIEEHYFEKLPDIIPQKYASILDSIIYNQIALLYNNRQNRRKTHKYAIRFKEYFFKVPESLHLFLLLYEKEELPTVSSKVLNILDIYLNEFGATLSKHYLNILSWHIFNYLLKAKEVFDSISINKKIAHYATQYPDLIGLKWWILLICTTQKLSSIIDEHQLDIFSHPITEDNEEPICLNLTGFITVNRPLNVAQIPFLAELFNADIKSIPQQKVDYKKCLLSLVATIEKAIQHAPPHPKAKVVLDVLKILGHEFYKAQTEYEITFSETVIQNFIRLYEKTLDHFGENHVDSVYFNQIQIFKYASEVQYLTSILLSENNDNIEAVYIDFIEQGQSELLINAVLTDITETNHFESEYKTALVLLFTLIFDYNEDKQVNPKKIIYSIVERYREQSDNLFECPCHEELYLDMLEYFLQAYNFPAYYQLIYWLTDAYLDLIVSNPSPPYYNMAGKLLTFMMKVLAKQPNFEHDSKFITTLMDFVTTIVKKRKLKTLGKTLERAQKFFASSYKV